jgi:hypothetical protein
VARVRYSENRHEQRSDDHLPARSIERHKPDCADKLPAVKFAMRSRLAARWLL